ncbi:UDP-4-amino-4,6-dideoxy-N-acetyl-beta-L-altrosamine transaminase [Oxalicibacterium solurbis]|uniref:UDP-4-amino-4,6-dideoxy-N-acetyl-beta-L-altrosamine transaminase n=1 Tax=Oxalicibacterium solurbis TaxID=69280 RepID=A0A8J3AZL4_9BURK|nr:UDP-4-amino-4,6-dideoxy-N-acetyl-beta-L-altrosamine transaminase [Oxalicibacterium solurbis]GGI54426.1 UDP-4-amino-4,6-dideoxy-N-acetyl-beta-L-altrosamine transaminase [Oxalicibacterium solurbis]
MIPYGRQNISEADIQAVVDVLRSDFLTQGPAVPAFEQAVATYCGVKHAVAVNSATSALHIACLALGVKSGDWVWTSPITFVASANCALYCGAQVDFVDIDPLTYNLSVECLEEKLKLAESLGRLPKVVIPVHLCGQSCDMVGIHALSQRYGFKVIEDASHAIGGKYRNEPIGNCRYSDITVFSFHPVKIITTGEGGMAVTNEARLAKKMQLFRSHGITRNANEMTQAPDGPWYYEQIELGFNYRMTDIQAALGLNQMKRLDNVVTKRNEIAKDYDRALADTEFVIPFQDVDRYSAFHLYVVRLRSDDRGRSRKKIFEALRDSEIGVNVHYIPVYQQPYYKKLGFIKDDYPEAEKYYFEAISLPMYPDLTPDQQRYVCRILKEKLAVISSSN